MCSQKTFLCSVKYFFPWYICPYDNKYNEIMFRFPLLLQLLQSLCFALLASMLTGCTVTNFGLKYIHNQDKFNSYWRRGNFSEFVHSYKYWPTNKRYFSSRKEATIWVFQTEYLLWRYHTSKVVFLVKSLIPWALASSSTLSVKENNLKTAIYLIS